jgi:hypothetical protein
MAASPASHSGTISRLPPSPGHLPPGPFLLRLPPAPGPPACFPARPATWRQPPVLPPARFPARPATWRQLPRPPPGRAPPPAPRNPSSALGVTAPGCGPVGNGPVGNGPVDNGRVRWPAKVLVHQVHPVKLAADITAAVISNLLLWKGLPRAALVVRVAVPVAASAAVLSLADLDTLAATRRGKYVLAHMPASAQAVRLAGDALTGLGAHRRSLLLLLTGAAVIAAGWSHAAWGDTACCRRLG